MHAYKQSLQERFGFADHDRLEPRHDLACRYLASAEGVDRVASGLIAPALHARYDAHLDQLRNGFPPDELIEVFPPIPEKTLTKGDGQYRTLVGFLDLVFPYIYRHGGDADYARGLPPDLVRPAGPHARDIVEYFIIEVKAGPVPATDIIRQVNLYREFCKVAFWGVVVAHPLTAADVASLELADIRHARLGRSFDEWCERERTIVRPAATPEL